MGGTPVDELIRLATAGVPAVGVAEDPDEPLAGPPQERSGLADDLARALERGELRVYYQPILALRTRRVIGFEALVRWQSPRRGLLAPAAFLDAAEETGLIVPIGLWVLERACVAARAWQQRYPQAAPLIMSVNLSARQFERPDLVDQVRHVLDTTGLAPECLKLEITETLVMHDPDAARAMLLQLRALDVRLGIDDFGTGYSSLAYLRKFPVHTLKIDRSFVGNLEHQKENLEIVRAIVTLARNLGLDVIAEGVETAGQVALLEILRCDAVQGYFVSKPLDEKRAEALLAQPPDARFDRPVVDMPATAVCEAVDEPPVERAETTPARVAALWARRRTRMVAWTSAVLAVAIFGFAWWPRSAALPQPARTIASVPASSAPAASVPAPAPPDASAHYVPEIQAAISAGHFVLPANTNAVYLCNRLLSEVTDHAVGQLLKEKSVGLALDQADDMVRQGDLDGARSVYVALRPLLAGDVRFAAASRRAQQGIRDIDPVAYPVTHDHFIGSCQGRLKFNAYTITFTPAEGTKHAFSERTGHVTAQLDGKFLKVVAGGHSYRFKAPPAGAPADMTAVHQELARRIASAPAP